MLRGFRVRLRFRAMGGEKAFATAIATIAGAGGLDSRARLVFFVFVGQIAVGLLKVAA